MGYDCDPRAVHVALSNVDRAGLKGFVHIEKKRELDTLAPTEQCGILAVNPPYGERLGEADELKPVYKQMGDFFKQRFAGWDCFILTSNPDLATIRGPAPFAADRAFNGALECRTAQV